MSARVTWCAFLIPIVGCSTAQLQDLNHDLPTQLVASYKASSKAYVDEGFLWLPGLLAVITRVSKTERGFGATETSTLGPLGIPHLCHESGRYDANGRLLQYASSRGYLWGALFSFGFDKAVTQKGWRSGDSTKILYGLLGYKTGLDGSKIFYFLYIPIPISDGDRDLVVGEEISAETP